MPMWLPTLSWPARSLSATEPPSGLALSYVAILIRLPSVSAPMCKSDVYFTRLGILLPVRVFNFIFNQLFALFMFFFSSIIRM